MISEDEYLNDNKCIGKKYFQDGNIHIDNIGKEYNDYNGQLIFEGEYYNKKRNGKGKEYYK